MKFTIEKSAILEALGQVQGVIASRTSLPVLGNVHIAAGKDSLTLTCTDLDIFCRTVVKADVKEEGTSTLPVRRLFAVLKNATAPEVNFSITAKHVASITCGSSSVKMYGLPGEEFPSMLKTDKLASVTITQNALADLLKKTKYAISHDETRYVLNGVLLELDGDEITAVATDGRRLALFPHTVPAAKWAKQEVIIPSKAVDQLSKLVGSDGYATIIFHKDAVTFEAGGVEFKTKIIEGTFPNYKQVMPAECKERVALNRDAFIGGLRRASLLASDKSMSVRLHFGKDLLAITSTTPEVGEAREELPIKFKGKEVSIAFNPHYMLEPLNALTDDEVFFELVDEMSPGVIKTAGRFVYVIMPMRLN